MSIRAEYTKKIKSENVRFKFGFGAYEFAEEQTGVAYTDLFVSLGKSKVLIALLWGAAKNGGREETTREEVIDWLDEFGVDDLIMPLFKELEDDTAAKEIKELVPESNNKKK
jgi:hypothetical protein